MKRSAKAQARKERVDCLGLGIMPLDLLFAVDDFPGPGEKRDARELTIQGGGPVPNVLVGLKRLGLSVALIAAVADDVIGELGVHELEREEIDTKFLIRKRKARSDTAGAYIERGSGRRTIVLYRSIGIRPAEIVTGRLPIPRLIHLDGRDLDASLKLARWGKRVGAQICMDIGSERNDVSPLFPLVDHLVVADSYALPYTNSRTARKAVERLRQLCPGAVLVTEGTAGSIGWEDGRWMRQVAYRVENVDTTGAGDAFHAGYIYGLLSGWDLARRMEFGAAVAALKCTKPGARGGAPKLSQVRKFLKGIPKVYG